jgi:hypothetical protein
MMILNLPRIADMGGQKVKENQIEDLKQKSQKSEFQGSCTNQRTGLASLWECSLRSEKAAASSCVAF